MNEAVTPKFTQEKRGSNFDCLDSIFMAFVSPSRQMLGQCFRLYNKHFLSYSFLRIVH
jgi:hypothetical protein